MPVDVGGGRVAVVGGVPGIRRGHEGRCWRIARTDLEARQVIVHPRRACARGVLRGASLRSIASSGSPGPGVGPWGSNQAAPQSTATLEKVRNGSSHCARRRSAWTRSPPRRPGESSP